MTAPTTTPRSDPSGTMLENGYQTLMAFANDADIGLWEKTVQPFGVEGGDKVDITTMHNQTVRTYAPQALKELTDSQMLCGYDPAVLSDILLLINNSGSVTSHMPDTSTWDFFGYLRSFVPAAHADGAHPEASCVVVATNRDPVSGDEEDPVYSAPSP